MILCSPRSRNSSKEFRCCLAIPSLFRRSWMIGQRLLDGSVILDLHHISIVNALAGSWALSCNFYHISWFYSKSDNCRIVCKYQRHLSWLAVEFFEDFLCIFFVYDLMLWYVNVIRY